MKKPTRKPVRKLKAEPKTRKRLAQLIREESDIHAKVDMARGFTDANASRLLKSDEDIHALIRDVDRLHAWFDKPNRTKAGSKFASYVMGKIGLKLSCAIIDRDWNLFQRLAAVLQFKKQPRLYTDWSAETYLKYLAFCKYTRSGTKDSPCDIRALVKSLETRGVKFSRTYDDEIPVMARRTCRKLGIIYTSKS